MHGVCRKNSINLPTLQALAGRSKSQLHLHYGDVTDAFFVLNTMKAVEPDEVYNFAAQSQVAHSFNASVSTFDTNTRSIWLICESIRTLQLVEKTRLFHASTSEMYGDHRMTKAESASFSFSEASAFKPMSPYAVSKVAAFYMCSYFARVFSIKICTAISFNHESPMRGEHFVTQKVVKHAVKQRALLLQQGQPRTLVEPLQLGNLDAERDWGHAADYCEAY